MRTLTALVLVWGLLGPAPAGAQAPADRAERPRVRLIATGGTISNRAGGRLTAVDLVQMTPELTRYVVPETEQFANVASGALTLDDWLRLARRVQALFAGDPDLAGIVITSGTDTLEETAYFLHLTVRSERPVVLVGAMRNPSTVGYDGAANLLDAFRVAAEPASRGRGVLVVLNDEINSARDVTKTDALRLHTFQSGSYGILGVADADRVMYYRDVTKRHTADSEFDISGLRSLPRVDVLLTYQGAPGDLIRAAVDAGARGLVVAAVGAGGLSGTQADGIAYATSKQVVVAIGSRTGSGRVPPRERPAPSENGRARRSRLGDARYLVTTEDLPPLKARILLMLALTRTSEGSEIQQMFMEY